MRVILIDDDSASRTKLVELLSKRRIKAVTALASLQEGIKAIEANDESVALAICNYRGGNEPLLAHFLKVTTNVPTILIGTINTMGNLGREANLDFLDRGNEQALLAALDQLCCDGVLETNLVPDAEFIRVPTSSLDAQKPPPVDFYLRLAPHRYCLRFRKEDGLDAAALEAYAQRAATEFLYARKDGLDAWFMSQTHEIEEWLDQTSTANQAEARKVAGENLEIVQNIVSQLGFTLKTEELAKKTVALTLKALGSSPDLSQILRQISPHDGKYISSHSLMLAEVACALAHQLSWSSSTTFLKLTMAAFIHDLSLPNNRIAQAKSLEEASDFGDLEIQSFRDHPAAAAELARQLRQLPADVDTIVLQHHEQPQGNGFPRGLLHHQITPLACVFIVAQDLLNHFIEYGKTGDNLLATFLARQQSRYAQGTFRKIFDSLSSGEPAPLA